MGTPRFYSWDDTGSPGRALTGNLQNMLKQILVPCLVTGYGGKPGAGWTLEHEHVNGFALSNGEHYINLVSNLPASSPYPAMNTIGVHVYVAESLTGTDGPFIVGANLSSGSYRAASGDLSPFARHVLTLYPLNQLSSLRWTVLADDKTAIVSLCSSSGSTVYFYQMTFYFGEMISDIGLSDTFVALGGDIKNYNQIGDLNRP